MINKLKNKIEDIVERVEYEAANVYEPTDKEHEEERRYEKIAAEYYYNRNRYINSGTGDNITMALFGILAIIIGLVIIWA